MNTNLILLHIGTHKTASTFLQHNYFPYIKNVHYFYGDQAFSNLLKSNYSLNQNILLSNEGFSGLAWNYSGKLGLKNDFHWIDSFNITVSNLHKLLPNARIIIFFRKHGDLLISMYKQYIQEGGVLKFDDFYSSTGIIRNEDLNYSQRIKKLCNLFNDVYIFSYEDFKKQGENLLNVFFKEELNLSKNNNAVSASKFSNKSITGTKIEILRRTNKVYNKFPLKLRKILGYIKCSPRNILQNVLSFWTPLDPDFYRQKKEEINTLMQADWEYVEQIKWKQVQSING